MISVTMRVGRGGEETTVTMDRAQFDRIAADVNDDAAAMAALAEIKAAKEAARARGDISSPELPPSAARLYDIMDRTDPRFAAAMGPKTIIELERALH